MINYSTTVIEYLGELEGENSGLAIYEGLMNRYSSLVTLEREEDYFISDENILASIADLNYNNSEYISSASFLFSTGEPAFVFKYSDAAEEVGIQRPGSSNYIGWTNGMFAYLAFANEDNQRPVQVFAYEGTIEDGTRLAYNDESWFDYEANSYYIVAKSYRHFENKSLYWSKHSVYNILGPVTMTVQNFDNTATEDVDESCAEAVTYSFAAYVNSLVTAHNEILASLETETDQVKIDALNAKSAEYKAAIDMSIALYAYAEAADAYVIR